MTSFTNQTAVMRYVFASQPVILEHTAPCLGADDLASLLVVNAVSEALAFSAER